MIATKLLASVSLAAVAFLAMPPAHAANPGDGVTNGPANAAEPGARDGQHRGNGKHHRHFRRQKDKSTKGRSPTNGNPATPGPGGQAPG